MMLSFGNQIKNNVYMLEKIIDIAPIAANPIFCSDVSETEILNFITNHSIDKNKIILGWAGRFVRLKKIDYLFELVSSLKNTIDTQLVLAGDYHNSDFDLEFLEKKYSIRPIYTGQLVPEELVKFYHSIDIFVLTSEYEGYGVVLKEALNTSRPVLVWDKSKGTNDILSNTKNGYYFKTKPDFHNKLIKAVKNGFVKEEIKKNKKFDVVDSIKET